MKPFAHRSYLAILSYLAFTMSALTPLPAQLPPSNTNQATPPPPTRRAALADIIASLDPALAAAREQLVVAARKDAEQPIIRRPRTLAELRATPRIVMKYAEKPAHHARLDDASWERFALSLGDSHAAFTFTATLPRLAAAVAITDDPALAAHINAQLAELATWSPLQRPGWSGARIPANDGAWLGTGWAVRAIVQTLELLPPRHLTPELRQALADRLEAEIAGIRDDWRARRNWFTQRDCAYSNQWVLPTEALILASLHTGLDRHRDDYEFGVKNLLRSLDAQGAQGEFLEGLQYAAITLTAVLSAARDTAATGDTRILSHPYLKKFPIWYVQHLQPGGQVINAFDTRTTTLDWKLLAQFVSDTRDTTAHWALHEHTDNCDDANDNDYDSRGIKFSDTLPALFARAVSRAIDSQPSAFSAQPSALDVGRSTLDVGHSAQRAAAFPTPPPLHAHYPVAARVNWRSSWNDTTATGFWMRGGHATDAHDHQDRGHVNFIIGKRPLLIEAGLYSYGIPEHPTHFKSVAGHNVLQVGNADPRQLTPALLNARAGQILDPAHRAAPITVHRLDADGGEVTMDGSACYATVERWVRHVTWDRATVDIRDEVTLREPDVILFRWHLGEPADALQTLTPGRAQVGGIIVTYETPADTAPLTALVQPMPDHTLRRQEKTYHSTLVLRTAAPARTLTLRTRVALAEVAGN